MASTSTASSYSRSFRVALAVIALLLLLLGLFAFRFILLGGLIGIGGGVLLLPLVRLLERRARIPHGLSVTLVVLALLVVFAGLVFGLYAFLGPQIHRLAEQGPQMWASFEQGWQQLQDKFAWLGEARQRFDPGAVLQQAAQAAFTGVTTGFEALAGILVVFAIAVFVCANSTGYLRGFLTLFPPERRARIETLAHNSARVLRRWFTGQLLVLAISSCLTALVLGLMGVDYWPIIALLTFALDFVPFFGAILTAASAVLLTLATDPDKVWWVLGAFIVLQQIETDVTLPLVMRDRVRLPEMHLLLFVLMMGTAFGALGVFVSPPLFAVLHYLYGQVYVPWVEKRAPSAKDG